MLKRATGMLVLALLCFLSTISAQTTNKKEVSNASDLPRFTYPVKGSASELVQSDAGTFNAFAAKVQSDLDNIFRDYDIRDNATLRELLHAKLDLQELGGDYKPALETIKQIRALEQKPSAKLTSGLSDEAWLEAAIETGNTTSPEFRQSFAKHYRQSLNALPWETVQDDIRERLRGSEINTKASALGWIETEYDPAVRTSGALDNHQAWDLIGTRQFFAFSDSVKDQWRSEIKSYVLAHNHPK